jgi:hypothetical protein
MCVSRVWALTKELAPNLLRQDFSQHRALTGAIEEAQDCDFLFGEAELVALGVDELLRLRPKRAGADCGYRIFARFLLSQLGTNPREQHRELKRLDDIVVGARFET